MPTKQLYNAVCRGVGLVIPLGVGMVIAGFSIAHRIAPGEPLIGRILSEAALIGLVLPLFVGSFWLWRRSFDPAQVWVVTGWALAGMLPLTALAILTVIYQRVEGVELAETWTIISWVAGAGMVGGMLTGAYDLRRMRAQRDAQQTAERLQTIFDVVPIPMIARGPDGTIRQWNPAAEETFGWSAEEILGESYPLVPDDRQDEYEEHLRRSESGQALRGVETQRERKDGSRLDVQIWSAPRQDADGHLDEVVLALGDITELKRRERSLHTLQEVGRDLVRARGVEDVADRVITGVNRLFDEPLAGIWEYDEENDDLQPICQTPTAAELVGEQPTLMAEDSIAWEVFESGEQAEFDDVRAETTTYNPETPMRSEIILPLSEFGVMIIGDTDPGAFDDIDAEIVDALAAATETALELADREEELRLFKRAAEMAGHAFVITDTEGTIQYVNPAFEAMTGFSKAEAEGANPRILKSGKHSDAFYADLWETILAGDIWEAELINQSKQGELIQVDQTVAPISDPDGTITHFVAVEHDISERVMREQRLSVLNRIMRHNLRNAMNIVEGNASLIEDSVEDADLRAQARAIENQANDLIELGEQAATVKNLFNRESDDGPVCDLGSFLFDLAPEFHETYSDARIDLTPPDGVHVQTDDRLAMAIREAVDNAVVHNDQSTPEVSFTVTPPEATDSGEMVEIDIADNGPGIPEVERKVIESGEETPLLHSGGMGLWLIYWVVRSFGGEVTIGENTPRGSIVTLKIPAAGA